MGFILLRRSTKHVDILAYFGVMSRFLVSCVRDRRCVYVFYLSAFFRVLCVYSFCFVCVRLNAFPVTLDDFGELPGEGTVFYNINSMIMSKT